MPRASGSWRRCWRRLDHHAEPDPDPFVFSLLFKADVKTPPNKVFRGVPIQPQGVVVGGETLGTTAVTVPDRHGTTTANSYASFTGPVASASIWVTDLSLSDATCSTRRLKGDPVTRVEGVVTASLNTADGWMEFHFADGAEITERQTVADGQITGVTLTAYFDGHRSSVDLSLWLDYVTRYLAVYDPSQNSVATTTSIPGIPAVVQTATQTIACE